MSGKLLRNAFLRRKPKPDGTLRDVKGLSVYLKGEISVEQIVEKYDPCFAVGSLHVGRIRAVKTAPVLDVIRDDINHANITGLPTYGEDDAKAEWLATQLAEQTYPVWNKS